jgi:hypothetical protein
MAVLLGRDHCFDRCELLLGEGVEGGLGGVCGVHADCELLHTSLVSRHEVRLSRRRAEVRVRLVVEPGRGEGGRR